MNYEEDFINRKWKVTVIEEGSQCPKGAMVAFGGEAKGVTIYCDEKMLPYPGGMYDVDADGSGRIMSDRYKIVMTRGRRTEIRFIPIDPEDGSIGGSWTAEDTGSGAGGDEQ